MATAQAFAQAKPDGGHDDDYGASRQRNGLPLRRLTCASYTFTNSGAALDYSVGNPFAVHSRQPPAIDFTLR